MKRIDAPSIHSSWYLDVPLEVRINGWDQWLITPIYPIYNTISRWNNPLIRSPLIRSLPFRDILSYLGPIVPINPTARSHGTAFFQRWKMGPPKILSSDQSFATMWNAPGTRGNLQKPRAQINASHRSQKTWCEVSPDWLISQKIRKISYNLGGGNSNIFSFLPLNHGERIQFDLRIFFNWVGSTTN